jgi:hypothetical protein
MSFLKSFREEITQAIADYKEFQQLLAEYLAIPHVLTNEAQFFTGQFLALKNTQPFIKVLINKDAPISIEKGCPHCGATITYQAVAFTKIGAEKAPALYQKYLYAYEAIRLNKGVCANMPPKTDPELYVWEALHLGVSEVHQLRIEENALKKINKEYVFLLTDEPAGL